MDDPSGSATTLAWLWVIEYLASFPHIEHSILRELIEAAPEIPDDFGKNTREMVALRCLEDLFCRRDNGVANDVTSKGLKVTFDLSESCEDVLQSILQETSVSDLNRGGPELLKWDIHPFIMHKRACMPKCALEKVKDAILEGFHPYASLKEYSELVNANDRGNRITTDYGDDGAPVGRVDGSDTDGQMKPPDESPIHLLLENENAGEDNSHYRNSLHSERERSGSASQNLAGDHEDQGCVDHLQPQAKRFKEDALHDNLSVGQISTTPPQHKDLLEDSFEMVVEDSENRDFHLAKESSQGGLEGSRPVENDHDEDVGIGRHGCSLDADNEFQHNQHEIAHNANIMPLSGDGLHQYSFVDEINHAEPRKSNAAPSSGTSDKLFINGSKDNFDHSGRPKPSNSVSSNGFHRNTDADEREAGTNLLYEEDESNESDEYDHERVDVGLKKSQFLSSQYMSRHDSLAEVNWTDQNLCVKCGKDGQLLVCGAGSCSLVTHENCLVFSPHFDERGDFYCPFCAYSLAISEYLEAKKKAYSARKELKLFIETRQEYQSNKHAQRLHSKRHGSSRQNEDEDLLNKFLDYENLAGTKRIQSNSRGQISEGNDHQFQKGKRKKQGEPFASCIGFDSLCREEEPDVNVRTNHLSTVEKEGEEVVRENSSGTELDINQHQVSVDPNYCDGNQLCKEKENVSGSQRIDGRRRKAVCAISSDGGDISGDEDDKSITTNYFIRFRKRERQYTPAMPQSRRKKVPWTAHEEEILKVFVYCVYASDTNICFDCMLTGKCIYTNLREIFLAVLSKSLFFLKLISYSFGF
ncbi:RING/FYVE/PHD ZINC FINGER SUPERFAMILY PROTEIN [Salix purpurea]|uniref:RING/FYVE/PHD ZINC FINGER SUPERFAMILY PROTEIN n=2 Tax=Salix purpurea TaxID=77065 RepID=A0A9Q0VWK0_SALPP|nr:RING/FYVE/PHD ZINC FINGER SUPERFAMILY PROTEIN [Salix purpurea]